MQKLTWAFITALALILPAAIALDWGGHGTPPATVGAQVIGHSRCAATIRGARWQTWRADYRWSCITEGEEGGQ